MSGPLTATGRKVVAIHGSALLDDVLGIEQELIEQRDALAEDEQACHEEVERLRATLDAARAAAPSVEPRSDPEDAPNPWEPPPASLEPTPGLREAIEKFVGTAYPNNGEGHTDKLTWTVPERAFGDLRRALAASPVPEPDGETETCPTCWQPVPVPQRGDHDYGIPLAAPEPTGLDADRLANAWNNLVAEGGYAYGYQGVSMHIWRAIAAEYARLTGEDS